MILADNRCIICRKPFAAKRKDARYCSAKCRQRSHRSVTDLVTDIVPLRSLRLLPIGVMKANEFIKEHHRHNGKIEVGARFAVAVVDDAGTIWGSGRRFQSSLPASPSRRLYGRGAPSVHQTRSAMGLLLHAVFRLLASVAGTRWNQDGDLHLDE
jgi:hypothetical protein